MSKKNRHNLCRATEVKLDASFAVLARKNLPLSLRLPGLDVISLCWSCVCRKLDRKEALDQLTRKSSILRLYARPVEVSAPLIMQSCFPSLFCLQETETIHAAGADTNLHL